MPYQPRLLPISARQLLARCHQLELPALLYSGLSGHARSSPRRLVLACQPDRYRVARTPQELQSLLAEIRDDLPPVAVEHDQFRSGWLGYCAFDAGELLPDQSGMAARTDGRTPLAAFGRYLWSLELLPDRDECWLHNPLGLPSSRLADVEHYLLSVTNTGAETGNGEPPPQWQPVWSRHQYDQAFDAVQNYLQAGDVYQVNLTMPWHTDADLRDLNPMPLLRAFDAPFSGYFRTPELTLLSVSPERFIRTAGGHITTSPIKGTSPRAADPVQDEANRQWLATSTKNQAENLMIVDLLRNDLGRSATTGSVRVESLFAIESHANVHHMVSTITAAIKPTLNAVDVFCNAFPGGSITGAPKRRAMEIISELEAAPRGLYCGSFGYFEHSGSSDFNILIRTIEAGADGAWCWGGGGIVIDSEAASEYQEVQDKIGRIMATRLTQESAR